MNIWVLAADLLPLGLAGALAALYAVVPAGRRRLAGLVIPRGQTAAIYASSGVMGSVTLAIAFSAWIWWFLSTLIVRDDPFAYLWWRYAAELLVAIGAVTIVLIVLLSLRLKPQMPVPPTARRGWRTYVSPTQLWIPGVALAALLFFVVFAGSLSSPDEEGLYRLLTVETGSGVSGASEFFGWAYGLPVAGAAVLLVAMVIAVLQAHAVSPFSSPDTVVAEEASRRALSTRLLWLCSGTLVLTLARVMLSVAGGAALEVNSPEYAWVTGIAALSPWLSWTGMVMKLWAYTLLLLVVGTTFPRSSPRNVVQGDLVGHERAGGAARG